MAIGDEAGKKTFEDFKKWFRLHVQPYLDKLNSRNYKQGLQDAKNEATKTVEQITNDTSKKLTQVGTELSKNASQQFKAAAKEVIQEAAIETAPEIVTQSAQQMRQTVGLVVDDTRKTIKSDYNTIAEKINDKKTDMIKWCTEWNWSKLGFIWQLFCCIKLAVLIVSFCIKYDPVDVVKMLIDAVNPESKFQVEKESIVSFVLFVCWIMIGLITPWNFSRLKIGLVNAGIIDLIKLQIVMECCKRFKMEMDRHKEYKSHIDYETNL